MNKLLATNMAHTLLSQGAQEVYGFASPGSLLLVTNALSDTHTFLHMKLIHGVPVIMSGNAEM